MDRGAAAYYGGGGADEVTLADNLAAFRRWRIVPRVMVDIANRDPSVEVLGRRWPAPVMVAPTALHRLAHPDGEVAVARACAARGLTMSLSTVGSSTIEDVAAAGAPTWFQLYLLKDPARNRELLDRAGAAGYEAIVLTVDAPILGRRERDLRTGFHLPPGVGYANIRRGGTLRDDTYGEDELLASYSWADLERTVAGTRLPVLVKGILHPDDARRAIDHGAAAIGVSNHGGRQLDLSIAALDALPGVVAAAGDRVPVLLDSGIRRGTDVLIALALGARAVMVGRPLLWALAWGGEAGVGLAFDLLLGEFDVALALSGVPRASDMSRELLVRAG
jgi:4-hydroxymandelate oxidase